jgi:serine/threonine protein kinase/Flp pilus assembly protein TadD
MPSLDSNLAKRPGRPRIIEPGPPATVRGQESEWISRQVQAMALAWSRGDRVTAEQLLANHPGMADEAAIRLIYEEVCLRRESGQDVATTEVVKRFPRWQDELEVLLGCDRMLRPFSRVAKFPEPGDQLGPFRLLNELGRGASGKTYLAAEPALGNRLVVLKVITDDQEEHLSLARLQHTHIIPLFSEQSFPERGLRALCMPYLGGASLARILEEVASISPDARRGRHILDALDQMRTVPGAHSLTVDGPYRRFLADASYTQAVCWIAACLADALQNAHAHGLMHMDVKPSNVLIAADGLPMLLDFHLARRPIRAGERIIDRLGGTPGWMAPEHRAAFEAVSHGEAVSETVDGRADVYALGLLVREAFIGPAPAGGAGATKNWRCRNPEVTVGLADIVDKCTDSAPDERYVEAGLLADDLRRYLCDQPLRGVGNRSPIEGWRKWRRRRPAALSHWTAGLITCAAVVVTLVLAQAYYRQRVREIEDILRDGKKLCDDSLFPEAANTLGRGLERAGSLPGVGNLTHSLERERRLALRGQKAGAVHDLADLIRFRHGIDLPSPEDARTLIKHISSVWNDRDLLSLPGTRALDPRSEQGIRTDLLDLAIASAELRVELATRDEADVARRDAVRLLDLASASCGPDVRLDRLRRSIAMSPQQPRAANDDRLANLSTLDYFDQGRSHLRAGRFREASVDFRRVLDDRPQDFWSNFYEGLCAYRLGRFHDALASFRTCIALAPSSAECYYNRARVAEALGRGAEALHDYDKALELDPGLTSATINRGIIAYKDGRNDDAITDLQHAVGATTDRRTVGLVRYNLALVHLARGDRPAALASAREAAARGHDGAQELHDRLEREP